MVLKRFFLIVASLAFLIHPVTALDEIDYEAEVPIEITLSPEMVEYLDNHIENYISEIQNLLESIDGAQEAQLKGIKRYIAAHDMRWTNFYELEKDLIASAEELLAKTAIYQETRQKTDAVLEEREKLLQDMADFAAAERTIAQHIRIYDKLYKNAISYSLIERLTPELEKLKAKDQLMIEDLKQQYELAHQVAKTNNKLNARWEKLEGNFVTIKSKSQKIQQLEYKPFMQRIKDDVMSMAAVAILLMFVSFIVMRIRAFQTMKKAAEEAKKQRDMLNQNYPTI